MMVRDSSTPLGMTNLDAPRPPRQLGLFDATMIVMGGIVGAGIFANPSEVAHRVHTPFLIFSVWVLGGLLAMCGAFIWAELATRLPGAAGGQYAYLREAYHPAVAFAYGGWQTATFVAAEIRDPRRNLSRGLLLGVAGVVTLYLAVNVASLRVLGPAGLDATTTPASDLMRVALGESGARWIAFAITISALGFLSQSMLTAPRVYYAMARDGLFFSSVGKLFGEAEAPVVAIILQGFAAIIIACSGYEGEILNFEVTVDFIFFGMTAAARFILRPRNIGSLSLTYRVPGHPFTTMLFVLSCSSIVLSAIIASPRNSAIALCIMLAGLPVYYFWSRFRRARS